MHESVSEHDNLRIQSEKITIIWLMIYESYIWVVLNDAYLEMSENGTSDSNEFASGGSRCLSFSFVEELGQMMYQN